MRDANVVVRLVALILLLAGIVAVALLIGVPSTGQVHDAVDSAGAAAPLAFVALYAVATLAPVPKAPLSLAAGALFGAWWGSVLVWCAAMVAALAAFVLARWLGRAGVERVLGSRGHRVDAMLEHRGLLAVLVLRLVPVVPFTALNYAAGLSSVGVRDFVLGTAVGIVPGTVAYVVLGAYVGTPGSWPFLVALAALLLLSAGGLIVARRSRRRSV